MRKEEGWVLGYIASVAITTTETARRIARKFSQPGENSVSSHIAYMTTLEQTGNEVWCQKLKTIFSARNITRIGTWNVKTLHQVGWSTQFLWIFDDYKLDILGISEILCLYGMLTIYITLFKDLYLRASCCVKIENGHTRLLWNYYLS